MIGERIQLVADFGESLVATFLELEMQASAPYNGFVYGSVECARRVQLALFEAGACEFAPPHGRAVMLDGRLVGMVAGLTASELTRARLGATLTLTRSGLLRDEALKQRVKLASRTLMHAGADDYYLSRLAILAGERGRPPDGRRLSASVLDLLEQDALARGATRFVAEVSADQPGVIAFYDRWGLRRVGEAGVSDPETGRELAYVHIAKMLP